jgi:hypothetical protein
MKGVTVAVVKEYEMANWTVSDWDMNWELKLD